MRDEAKAEAVNRKNSKPKATSSTIIQEGVDPEFLASMVRDKMKGDVNLLDAKNSKVDETLISFQAEIIESLKEIASKIDAIVVKMTLIGEDQPSQYYVSAVNAGTQTTEDISTIINNAVIDTTQITLRSVTLIKRGSDYFPDVVLCDRYHLTSCASCVSTLISVDSIFVPLFPSELSGSIHVESAAPTFIASTLAPALIFPKPTFSLGLTQDHRIEMEAVMVVVSLHWKVVVKTLVLKQR
ncbi:unnamed protein product [Brassica rapa]|uniref:Uncharacterized protein n=1 Tax=Brassica campestris TaxID=3711 RepID=A0A8D9GRX5_BRACM|nr:unnamed protein product [Brassica rapa]